MIEATDIQEKQAKVQALERLVPVFIVAALLLVILPFMLFLGARLLLPGDGTRVVFDFKHAKASGLTVRPLIAEPDGLHTDDIVVAVEGRAIHAWLKDVLDAHWNQVPPRPDLPLVYTIARSSGNVQVPVRLIGYPFGQALMPNWSLFIFQTYLLLVSVFVAVRRPALPAARIFVLLAIVLFAGGTIFGLGLQVSDLVRGWPAALWLWGVVGMDCLMMATVLHFTLVFPRRLPLLVKHPSLLLLVYGGAWIFYGAFLMLQWPSAVSYVERFLLLLRGTAVFMVAYLLLVLLSWLYSYRTSESLEERLQFRWILWGMAVAVVPFLVISLIPSALGRGPSLDANYGVVGLCFCALPTAFTIAILRERLFDIDVIINRTLVYITLSGLLALIYFGSILLLTELVRAITGETQRQLVTVVATLLSAVVFSPLRRRVQVIIDRRFFRSKYDATRILMAFGTRVRDDVDLQHLSASLVAVINESMQPEQISLWLPKHDQRWRG